MSLFPPTYIFSFLKSHSTAVFKALHPAGKLPETVKAPGRWGPRGAFEQHAQQETAQQPGHSFSPGDYHLCLLQAYSPGSRPDPQLSENVNNAVGTYSANVKNTQVL